MLQLNYSIDLQAIQVRGHMGADTFCYHRLMLDRDQQRNSVHCRYRRLRQMCIEDDGQLGPANGL